ncbi:carbamoyltransferase [Pseudomonas sp. MH9.3]|uniref:carbamoyltransferase family protein n=1 Tax=Pseudomonas sp. MH9.3 TaxID=3048630 RepID=UPI002AC99634|nr:carbamoyltransferase [Pseudomonas sp. MH9.3]MEB0105755.1 carbamoyltransferase [Pseudomonas sp. MH9.3]WPX80260.1 carbamoyltransferase [Pseudomonas sp. MH9.3]WQG57767.1 carbamoyltransferase [Pseudomonas sp. RTB3]
MTCYVLGISAYYHDSAAALLGDGHIVAAAQEERFSRKKQDARFPRNAIDFCLEQAGITLSQVNHIYYYENPYKKLSRIGATYLNFGAKGMGSFLSEMPAWLTEKVHIKRTLKRELASCRTADGYCPAISYIDHHQSHAASAFYASPYDEAAVLCIDGVGEWATTSAWWGNGKDLKPLWDIRFPHSLGLLYSAFTYFCGFKVDSGEYKLMGLAPYGNPVYAKTILDHLIDVKDDGSFWLDMSYFDYAVGDCMVSEKFAQLFGGPRREPESQITQREFDLAASVQQVLEGVILKLAQTIKAQTGARHLCMAGGVALNCVANGKLLESGIFESIWVQPAAGDSGGALGAAYTGWYERRQAVRPSQVADRMAGSLLGSCYNDVQVEAALNACGAVYRKVSDEERSQIVAEKLAAGRVIGWFQGKMEFGPRSLGSRSILGDPRNPDMQSVMNLKIKNRESFRPFAPAVLEDHAATWFDLNSSSPYMLFVVPISAEVSLTPVIDKPLQGIEKLKVVRSHIPAVTHVDYSARVQTVNQYSNSAFHALLQRFHALTGCPVLINTSFNVRGEPIVETPQNAYLCFLRTHMDDLVIGHYVMEKDQQPALQGDGDWRTEFELD